MTTHGAGAGVNAGTTAAAAAVANAVKASGTLVRLEPDEWQKLAYRATDALVVVVEPRGLFQNRYEYLLSYKGLAFHTKSKDPLALGGAETVTAKSLWMPH